MHAALGGRLRFAVSGGAPLSREIAEFFHAAGILILEGYGLTETCPVAHHQPARTSFKFGSVGQALPGVEIKIAPDGEILGRGRQHRQGLLQEAGGHRARSSCADGWFATGDIGRDRRGRLPLHHRPQEGSHRHRGRHEHRAAEHREPAQGRSRSSARSWSTATGGPYPVALITLNPEELAKFAREQGILTRDPAALAKHPRWSSASRARGGAQRASCSRTPRSRSSRSCADDFTVENGVLTPTLKVKRKVITEKHRAPSTPSTGEPALDAASARRPGRHRHRRQPRARARDGAGARARPAPTWRWPRASDAELEETARGRSSELGRRASSCRPT